MKKLYIQQKVFKITDHYPVLDENRNPVYYVDQDFKLIGNTVHVNSLDGKEVFSVNKEVLTIMPKYVVTFDDGRQAVLKSRFSLFNKRIDVELDDSKIELKGNFFDFQFTIFEENCEIGSISKELFAWGDTYVLNIIDESKEKIILALMIAVDCIKDSEEKN